MQAILTFFFVRTLFGCKVGQAIVVLFGGALLFVIFTHVHHFSVLGLVVVVAVIVALKKLVRG